MAMLAELVDVGVGVDTHKHSHTAAVVSASTGGALAVPPRRLGAEDRDTPTLRECGGGGPRWRWWA